MASQKVWFITGASSGFGRCMTEYVLSKGDIAVATLRNPAALASLQEKYPPTQLLILKLDVSKPENITAAFAAAQNAFARVDVVFNNAGYAVLSEIESEEAKDVARAMFEVNFWGAVNVSTEAVKFFREVNSPKGGRLLNVSAVVGMAGFPTLGYYGASKHALEGVTKSLAKELSPDWNIKITLIEPGGFETRITTAHSATIVPTHPAYESGGVRYAFANPDKMPPMADTNIAVAAIYEIAEDQEAPFRVPLGIDALACIKMELDAYQEEVQQAAKYSAKLSYAAGANPFVK